MQKTEEVRDRVVLVGLNSPVLKKEETADEGTMEELAALVETAGAETVGVVLQNRAAPDPRTFIGEGKVEEIREYCRSSGATMVIFDNDLSPSQMRVLTESFGLQVLDRCGLILDIFAQRSCPTSWWRRSRPRWRSWSMRISCCTSSTYPIRNGSSRRRWWSA